jgi:hypothetical protein
VDKTAYVAASFLTGGPQVGLPKLSLHQCQHLPFSNRIAECFVGFRPADCR